MKATAKTKIISFILAVVMLMSGMCFGIMEADSMFLYPVNENAVKVLTSAKEMPTSEQVCTNEMLGKERLQSREISLRKNDNRSAVRAGMVLSSLEIPPIAPLFKKEAMMSREADSSCGEKTIIAYIHHQDGEKGSF